MHGSDELEGAPPNSRKALVRAPDPALQDDAYGCAPPRRGVSRPRSWLRTPPASSRNAASTRLRLCLRTRITASFGLARRRLFRPGARRRTYYSNTNLGAPAHPRPAEERPNARRNERPVTASKTMPARTYQRDRSSGGCLATGPLRRRPVTSSEAENTARAPFGSPRFRVVAERAPNHMPVARRPAGGARRPMGPRELDLR